MSVSLLTRQCLTCTTTKTLTASPFLKYFSTLNTCRNSSAYLTLLTRGLKTTTRLSFQRHSQVYQQTPGPLKLLTKSLLFTVSAVYVSVAASSIWQYETLRTKIETDQKSEHLARGVVGNKGGSDFRSHVNYMWNNLTPGEKCVASLIGLNILVFAAWRIPALQAAMTPYFLSSPATSRLYSPMLLSAFSHVSALHLAANMYVLWSFTPTITKLLGREQFLAMYLSAAVVSSYTSYLYKITRKISRPSLGASGAIMAVLGAVCTLYPNTRLSVVFLDQIYPHSFSAGSAMQCIIAFDVLGVLLGFRLFDHAAHLGGMLFGIWYVKYGHKYLWLKREPVLVLWHKLRGTAQK